jgi:hypothetical protein
MSIEDKKLNSAWRQSISCHFERGMISNQEGTVSNIQGLLFDYGWRIW